LPRQWVTEIRRWRREMRHASGQDFLHNATTFADRHAVVRNVVVRRAIFILYLSTP
jgi:hypothetical protein